MEKGFWRKTFTSASVYFAVLSTVIFVIKFFGVNSVFESSFSTVRMLLLFGFCIVMSIANTILPSEKLNGFAKLIIHAAFTYAGFFLLIFAPMEADNKYHASLAGIDYQEMNVMVVIGMVTIIYAICYGIWAAIHSKVTKKKNTKSEYKSLYRDKK